MVGEIGFEPTTPASQTLCAAGLRHSPMLLLARAYCTESLRKGQTGVDARMRGGEEAKRRRGEEAKRRRGEEARRRRGEEAKRRRGEEAKRRRGEEARRRGRGTTCPSLSAACRPPSAVRRPTSAVHSVSLVSGRTTTVTPGDVTYEAAVCRPLSAVIFFALWLCYDSADCFLRFTSTPVFTESGCVALILPSSPSRGRSL
jgi:hypothetical protein